MTSLVMVVQSREDSIELHVQLREGEYEERPWYINSRERNKRRRSARSGMLSSSTVRIRAIRSQICIRKTSKVSLEDVFFAGTNTQSILVMPHYLRERKIDATTKGVKTYGDKSELIDGHAVCRVWYPQSHPSGHGYSCTENYVLSARWSFYPMQHKRHIRIWRIRGCS